MTIDRSTQFFTLDGLTAFKETVIKNYAKIGTIDAYIDSVIYNAMMQYKRDIVKFVSAKSLLPGRGNPGTLYMVPKGTDDLRYKPMTNEIWVTSTGGFNTMRLYVNGVSKYVDMPKNEYGFFVLDLNNVDPFTNKGIAFLESTETSVPSAQSTAWLYMPTVTGSDTLNVQITSFAQLHTLGGSIVSVEKRDDRRMVTIPVPQSYVGDKADVVLSKNTGEIWINAPYDGDYLVCQFSTGYTVNAPRNEYGYYVLSIDNLVKRRIEYLAIYKPNSANTTNIRRMDTNAYLVTKYSDLVNLVGSAIAITLDSNAYAILLSDYEQEFSETYTIPDDEIWVSSDLESCRYNTSASYNNGFITEKNEYGFFVLKKGVHFSDDPNNTLHTGVGIGDPNSSIGFRYAFTKESGVFSISDKKVTELYKLCGHVIVCPETSDSSRNILVAIYPQDTTTSNIATLVQTPGVTIPSDEIWIDSANWPTLCLYAYNNSNTFSVELNKNEYGYYVLRSGDYTAYANDGDYNLRLFTLDIEAARIDESASAKYATGNYFNTNPDSRMYYRKRFSWEYNYVTLQTMFSLLGGERVILSVAEPKLSVIPDELPIITYTGANGDQFVTYAYENGKYVILGSTVFNLSDVTIDRSLDGNSLHAVQNKIIENALNTKYNVADITETIEHGNDNLVTSKAIQAALANKLDWADLKNITLYQLMRELRFPWNMPTKMYFKLVVYAPLVRQDLAIFYPTLTQRLQFWTYGGNGSFVSTDNKFTYSTYSGSRSKYIDGNTGDEIWLQNSFDLPMYSYTTVCLSGHSTSNQISNINEDMQFTITSEAPVSMSTLANLSYKFRAYSANESSTHSHLNQIYVSTYLSPDGVDWHPLQNKTVYKWDDNYEDLNDYIYLIPILA